MKILIKWQVVVLILLIVVGCSNPFDKLFKTSHKYKNILENIDENNNVLVNKYTIYGKHFNIEGVLEVDYIPSSVKIVLKNGEKEYEYDTIYDENNIFKTSEYINKGILLDNIPIGNYLILLKVINNDDIIYYNLNNNTNYTNLDYYTITKNNKNNHIVIDYDSYNNYKYLKLEVSEKKLPNNVYDIVIDPGHGGIDSGAVNGKYHEDEINLEYSLMIKEALEDLGLKVKLTRETNQDLKHYGHNSRTSIPYEVKAKLMLSIHLNSSSSYIKNGGVEVYIASLDDPYFAKRIASDIVNYTSSSYSPNTYNRLSEGVYLRIYNESDVKDTIETAVENNWVPYEIKPNTTYYYFIRETGGIMTNAFADGRNPKYEANPYYNSNHGTEAYLLELGYMSNSKNLKILLNEKAKYVKAIKDSVTYYIQNSY